MRASTRVVAGVLFCSGLSALVYQTAWQRSLRLVFGASTAASAAVLAVFLGGLGVGGVFLGRRAERSPRPLLLYSNLEIGVAVTAAVSPFVMSLLGKLYLVLGGSGALGTFGATVVRMFIALVAMGPSVVLMGGTLPAAARSVERDADQGRTRLAVLYGANALGAVAGALAGTFVLFELFGIRLSLLVAALLNLLVAMVARALARGEADVPAPPAPGEASTPLAASRAPASLAYGVAFGVGFAFLLLEIVWYRLLAPLLGGSTYTFGLILAMALAGIGLGGLLYALRGEGRRATLPELATVTALEGVCVAIPLVFGDTIAVYTAVTHPLASVSFAALVASWASVTALVVFPAALVSGYQFPLLFALIGEGREKVARQVGAVYAMNTAGSIAGSLLGGLVLVPRISVVGCLRVVVGTLLALSVVVVAKSALSSLRTSVRLLPAVALAGLGVVFSLQTGPTAIWRHQPIGAGRAIIPLNSRNAYKEWAQLARSRTVWEADGIETAVALLKTDELVFVVDGKADGAVFSDRGTQAMLGLLAAILHPSPREAFVVGLGTGMSAGWLGSAPEVQHVDVAELEPSIVEVARAVSAANQDILSNPKVALHFGDARELLLTSRKTYDIIASEPSNPYRAGISALYTREFYDAARSRMRDDGIFVQWMQGYEVDAETVRTVVRTLRSVFGNVEAWQTQYGDVLLVAARKARILDVERLRPLLEREPYRSALSRNLLVGDVEGLLSHFVATDAELAAVSELPGVAINTDDENVLEYAFARAAGTTTEHVPTALRLRAMRDGGGRPAVSGDVDWDRVVELVPRSLMSSRSTGLEMPAMSRDAGQRAMAVGQACAGRSTEGFRVWETQSAEPRDDIERFVVGMGRAAAGDDRGSAIADGLEARGFVLEAELIRAHRARHDGDIPRALAALTKGFAALRKQALPLCSASRQALVLLGAIARKNPGLIPGAVDELMRPFAAGMSDEERTDLLEALAEESGDPALCVRALGEPTKLRRWNEGYLRRRVRCLSAAKHPAAAGARADLQRFLADTGGSFD